MASWLYFLLIAVLCILLQHPNKVSCSTQGDGGDTNCVVEPPSPGSGGKSSIKCTTGGQAIDQALSRATTGTQRGATAVALLNVSAGGDVTIKEGGLRDMPVLEKFVIKAKPGLTNVQLIMPPGEFRNTPRLWYFEAERITFPPGTLGAMLTLKDQLKHLNLASCKPSEKILNDLLNKFGRLEQLALKETETTALTNALLFRGLVSLKTLEWTNDKISQISPTSFDDLLNVEVIDLSNNQLRGQLPPGLFKRNTKLRRVVLRGNAVQGLTRADFAHCPNFQSLEL